MCAEWFTHCGAILLLLCAARTRRTLRFFKTLSCHPWYTAVCQVLVIVRCGVKVCRSLREKKQEDMDQQLTSKKGKGKKWTGERISRSYCWPSLVEKVDELIDETSILTLQKRQLLHDRVTRLAELRSVHMKTHLEGLCVPGKFFYVDNFWLENLMTSFCVCEDWSSLLKTCIEFRKK